MLVLFAALGASALPSASALPAGAAPPTVEVAVLDRPVERGEPVSAADFTIERRPAGVARGALSAAAAAGLEATHGLSQGSVVRPPDLTRPQTVHRGETVTIAYRIGGLAITTTGRALSGGRIGDPVRVVSLATNHTLDATIEGSGHVRLAD